MHAQKLLALAVILAVAACSGGNKAGSATGQVSISAAGSPTPTPTPTPTPPAASPDPTSLTSGLRLTAVNVAFRELELGDGECVTSTAAGPKVSASSEHTPGAGAPSGSEGSHDPEHSGSADRSHDAGHASGHPHCDGELGPFVAHLDAAALSSLAAGQVPRIWTGTLPTGTYSELEATLCGIDPSRLADPAQAALAASMAGATVVIEGTYQAPGAEAGQVPFSISVNACAELERHVRVTVDEQGALSNLTVRIDVASWFRDATGAPLVPDTAANRAAIAAKVAASLDLYGDDDHDGRSDD